MKNTKPGTFAAFGVLAVLFATLVPSGAHAAGFQRAQAADPDGKALAIGIWYPSQATPRRTSFGATTMSVAVDSPIDGRALPLIVISHGTGGSLLDHYDTAIALADAGYVVAAVTHRGDNHADRSRSVFIMDRPRQISRVIDHVLSNWAGSATIDPSRIGMFGFSAGGFTTLASIGGRADFSRIGPMCSEYPGDFVCQLLAKAGPDGLVAPDSSLVHDARIKAAVVAAPALGFTFAPDGLKDVRIPVQLWRAEEDALLPHPRYAEPVRQALGISDYHVVSQAGHFDFLPPCSDTLATIAPMICTSNAGFDRAAFHLSFNTSVVDFFSRSLGRHRAGD
ncbi:alpha/beta hydrolase family protein [Duganella sp. BuS-21]|uniref:alpha/beta hydrolase family protein n=1 Tax=Duganella sp. BuS-21 TaxID=2943848 RepID=UPI0035A5E15E